LTVNGEIYRIMEQIVTYHGHVQTSADAIKLFEACRLGLLPRVQRRLSEIECQFIKSGSVFVWDEREAMIQRWTDGKSWSPSRVAGGFRISREIKSKERGSRQLARQRENTLGCEIYGDQETESDRPDRLIKQLCSITTSNGNHLHLISYHSRSRPNCHKLPRPTTDPKLRHIIPVSGMYIEPTVYKSLSLTKSDRGLNNTIPQNTTPVCQQNSSPYIAQSTITTIQQAVHQLVIARQALHSALMVDPCTSHPSILLRSIHETQNTSTPGQHYTCPVSSNTDLESIGTASRARSILNICNLINENDSDLVMSSNDSDRSRGRDESLPETAGYFTKTLHTSVDDQRVAKILDQKFGAI
jgi:hypothetical protein